MLMLERNNRRRKKLFCLLVYNLVVETRNIQKNPPKTPPHNSRLFRAYILTDVCLQDKEGAKALVADYISQVKASGRTEPSKGSPEWGREVSCIP